MRIHNNVNTLPSLFLNKINIHLRKKRDFQKSLDFYLKVVIGKLDALSGGSGTY